MWGWRGGSWARDRGPLPPAARTGCPERLLTAAGGVWEGSTVPATPESHTHPLLSGPPGAPRTAGAPAAAAWSLDRRPLP